MHYIYKITNLINNKVYIGQTVQPKIRWSKHKSDARNKPIQYIHHAMNRYGIDNFKFEVIAFCLNSEAITETENIIIIQYDSRNRNFGYNLAIGKSHGGHSKQTREKLSRIKTEFYQKRLEEVGSKITEEERQKLSESHLGLPGSNKGKKFSEQARENMRQAFKGRIVSEECKQKKSESMKMRYQQDPDFREKIRQASTGRFKLKNQETEICALYQSGLTSRQIGNQFNVSSTTICSILKRHDIILK